MKTFDVWKSGEGRRDLRLVSIVLSVLTCDLIHYYYFSGACGDNLSMSLDGSESSQLQIHQGSVG
jgi:hypothetical protein